MKPINKFAMVIFALVLVFSSLGAWAAPALAATDASVQAVNCGTYYTVKPGDNLYRIGVWYGVSWTTLVKWNSLKGTGAIYAGQVLCVAKAGSSTGSVGTGGIPAGTIPTFSILSVKKDVQVNIQTYNFPANDTFVVRMGEYGTLGIGGIKVGEVKSGAGGSFSKAFEIPAALQGSYRIAIRLESPTSGYFAYNWFYNNTAGSGSIGSGGIPGYSGYPTFFITAVTRNNSVTITAYNLPAHVDFEVRMGKIGTRAVGGYYVTTFNSGAGGTQAYTFSIPSQLYGVSQIAVRFENWTTGYYAYNWFWNNTTP